MTTAVIIVLAALKVAVWAVPAGLVAWLIDRAVN